MKNIIPWVFLVIFLMTSFVRAADGESVKQMGLLECLEFALENHSDIELARLAILEAEYALEKLEMADPREVAAKDLLAKKQDVEKAKESLKETGINLALNVESKYYQVLKTIATTKNKLTSLNWAQKQLAISEVKYANGVISEKEHTALKKRVIETEKAYANMLFNLKTVRMEMNLALGCHIDQYVEFKEQEFPYESLKIDFTEATQYALEYGKKVLQAREVLKQSRENLEFKIDSESAQTEVIKAEHQLKEAEIKLKRAETETIIQIRNAYRDVYSLEDKIRDADNTYAEALENLEVLNIKYDAGMVSLIDFLQGQRELADADVERIQLIYDYNLAKASFCQLIGQGYSLVKEGGDK